MPARPKRGNKADQALGDPAQAWGAAKGGHMADTRRTQSACVADKLEARGQSISRPTFFPKREPDSKLFGEYCKQ